MKTIVLPLCAAMMCLVFLTPTVWGQTPTPNANLSTIGLIPVPGWTTAAGAFDLASFDPLNRIMYFADGTNHAITSVIKCFMNMGRGAAVVLAEAFGEVELHSTWFMYIVAGQAWRRDVEFGVTAAAMTFSLHMVH